MHLIQRKRLRLKGFDYSSSGCYFVTISTYNRKNLFWNYDKINDVGRLVESEIQQIDFRYDDVRVDNFVVMPNHVHLLITIGCDALVGDDKLLDEVLGRNVHPELQIIVGALKSGITRKIHENTPGIKVWHKSFFDHIVTNKKEYKEIWDYIDANPIRWKIKHGFIKEE